VRSGGVVKTGEGPVKQADVTWLLLAKTHLTRSASKRNRSLAERTRTGEPAWCRWHFLGAEIAMGCALGIRNKAKLLLAEGGLLFQLGPEPLEQCGLQTRDSPASVTGSGPEL